MPRFEVDHYFSWGLQMNLEPSSIGNLVFISGKVMNIHGPEILGKMI